jgi:uncharacterized membrane protein
MNDTNHIRNPIEWSLDQVKAGAHVVGRAGDAARETTPPTIRRIAVADLGDALARGWKDLGAKRSDIAVLCIVYPVVGLLLARVAYGYDMLPLVFPLISGFALLGPVAAVGLYEISRRRELGLDTSWASVFAVVHAPSFGGILLLSALLFGLFVLWLVAAYVIFAVTLGPEPPVSLSAFVSDIFSTAAGWTMIVVGIGVGFLFAVVALVVGVVSFPLLVDRNVGVKEAVATSLRAARANPVPIAVWGLIVAVGLVLGSIPALLGLVIVLPLLGHATWHLYRKVVAPR